MQTAAKHVCREVHPKVHPTGADQQDPDGDADSGNAVAVVPEQRASIP